MATTQSNEAPGRPKKKMGRPSTYSEELVDKICSELATGKSLRTVLKMPNMPEGSTAWKWLRENDYFSQQYAKAKQEAADAMAEDVLDIADDVHDDIEYRVNTKTGEEYEVVNREAVARSKLRMDARIWLMSKMKPKKYGEKLELDGLPPNPIKFVNEVPTNQSVPTINQDTTE